MRLQDKVVLITGAGGGIGGESALLFAAEGASVVVVDFNESAGNDTVARVRKAGGKATFVLADVSKDADCARMVKEAEREYGKLDVLFNNAGIMDSADDDATLTPEDVWERTLAINLKGVFLGCKHGIPALRRAGGGSVINTVSFVAFVGAATPQLAYREQGRPARDDARARRHPRAREDPRERALPGPAEDGAPHEVPEHRRQEAAPPRPHPHGPLRRGEGDGEGRALPRLGRFLLHDGRVATGGRRDHGGVRDAGVSASGASIDALVGMGLGACAAHGRRKCTPLRRVRWK
jgi:NAD(P)-dependent dehydrogenase (short-subunit alcohol dehydrogenase family)